MNKVAAPTAVDAWRSLVETHALLWRLLGDDLESECGISLVDYEVLLRLHDAADHRLRLQDLVSPGRMTKSGVSRLVDRLEATGLIRLESCPSDRRGAFAVLTPKGRAMQECGAMVHVRGINQYFAATLRPGEDQQLTSVLNRIRAGLPGATPRDCAS